MNFILKEGIHQNYAPGQVWKYSTREGEEDSELTILRIDSEENLGLIIHISLNNLSIENKRSESGYTTFVMHMPFSEEAFISSLEEKVSDNSQLPDYQDGYNTWREAFEKGQAGIFTIGIRDAIAAMEQAINS